MARNVWRRVLWFPFRLVVALSITLCLALLAPLVALISFISDREG